MSIISSTINMHLEIPYIADGNPKFNNHIGEVWKSTKLNAQIQYDHVVPLMRNENLYSYKKIGHECSVFFIQNHLPWK